MAATNSEQHHVPGVLGGDLPDREQTALEESHDADIPVNENEATDRSLQKKTSAENEEKAEKRDVSSNSSEDGSPQERDLEKGQAEAHVAEEQKEENDPNIVDWDGPEDPENPQNVSGFWLPCACHVELHPNLRGADMIIHADHYVCTCSGPPARNGPISGFYPSSRC